MSRCNETKKAKGYKGYCRRRKRTRHRRKGKRSNGSDGSEEIRRQKDVREWSQLWKRTQQMSGNSNSYPGPRSGINRKKYRRRRILRRDYCHRCARRWVADDITESMCFMRKWLHPYIPWWQWHRSKHKKEENEHRLSPIICEVLHQSIAFFEFVPLIGFQRVHRSILAHFVLWLSGDCIVTLDHNTNQNTNHDTNQNIKSALSCQSTSTTILLPKLTSFLARRHGDPGCWERQSCQQNDWSVFNKWIPVTI